MGNPYPGEEWDVEAIRRLVEKFPSLRNYLSHHLRNGLCMVMAGEVKEDFAAVQAGRNHIEEDLRRVGL